MSLLDIERKKDKKKKKKRVYCNSQKKNGPLGWDFLIF